MRPFASPALRHTRQGVRQLHLSFPVSYAVCFSTPASLRRRSPSHTATITAWSPAPSSALEVLVPGSSPIRAPPSVILGRRSLHLPAVSTLVDLIPTSWGLPRAASCLGGQRARPSPTAPTRRCSDDELKAKGPGGDLQPAAFGPRGRACRRWRSWRRPWRRGGGGELANVCFSLWSASLAPAVAGRWPVRSPNARTGADHLPVARLPGLPLGGVKLALNQPARCWTIRSSLRSDALVTPWCAQLRSVRPFSASSAHAASRRHLSVARAAGGGGRRRRRHAHFSALGRSHEPCGSFY